LKSLQNKVGACGMLDVEAIATIGLVLVS